MIVLETSVLRRALSRRSSAEFPEPAEVVELRRLVEEDADLAVPGIVWQELLGAAASEVHSRRLQRLLDAFPLLLATRATHALAARLAASCRGAGRPALPSQCLVAATTIEARGTLFCASPAFAALEEHSELRLHRP